MASKTKLNAPAALVKLPLAVRPLLQREGAVAASLCRGASGGMAPWLQQLCNGLISCFIISKNQRCRAMTEKNARSNSL
jgi:hypothetical protein